MQITWLGWAGFELEAEGETLVVDPLGDPAALWGVFGDRAADVELPVVTPATPGRALAGLVTHLHRDHADAPALRAALAPGAPVLGPHPGGGEGPEDLGLAQAEAELAAAGLAVEPVEPWAARVVGPFRVVALPAVDGSGDPQVSWLVEAGGQRVVHLGDTMWHAFWWRIAQRFGPADAVLAPVNGAVLDLPHRQPASPLPAAMDPEQAALAAERLQARVAVPMHFGGFAFAPFYRPVADPLDRFAAALAGTASEQRVLAPGQTLAL